MTGIRNDDKLSITGYCEVIQARSRLWSWQKGFPREDLKSSQLSEFPISGIDWWGSALF